MTATAKKLRDDVGGFPTMGSLYEVSPPIAGASHLVLFYAPSFLPTQAGKLVVLRATPNGASFTKSVDPIEGTYLTSAENADHATALWLAGRYVIVADDDSGGDES